MSDERIVGIPPEWDWERNMPPAPGVRFGDLIFLSGQLPLDAAGNVVGSDITAQAHQCFRNIRDILRRAGAEMPDILKMTTYFTVDITQGLSQEYWEVRKQYFGAYRPASTGVRIAQLLYADCLLEIEVVAAVRGRARSGR